MDTYKIPIMWTVFADMYVEADSLEGAVKRVLKGRDPLPGDEAEFLDGSLKIDWDILEDSLYDMQNPEDVRRIERKFSK